jgi:hypothetical protein
VFAVCALLFPSFLLLALQGAFILFLIAMGRTGVLLKVRLSAKELLPIVPVVGFVFVLNCFRGGGQVMLRWGPVLLIKQGMFRGLYYSGVIIELFLMSRALSRAFSSGQLLSSLSFIDAVFPKFGKNGASRLILVLYHVLGIFSHVYAEMKIFFRGKEWNLRQRTVQFFLKAFDRSLQSYEEGSGADFAVVRPTTADILLVSIQICAIAALVAAETVLPVLPYGSLSAG